VTFRSILHLKIKKRPLSRVLSTHLLTGECLLVFAMHLAHSSDA
ncbi:hypothetical protein A2U01_0106330, partial [Trifolium medium]|nr:hypothetical protein [Trifolium medium]